MCDGVPVRRPYYQGAQNQHVQRSLHHLPARLSLSAHSGHAPLEDLWEKDTPLERLWENNFGKCLCQNLPEFASRLQRSWVWPQTPGALYLGSMRALVCCQGLLQKANGSLRCTEISSRFTSGK
jgi:hypothetical protein